MLWNISIIHSYSCRNIGEVLLQTKTQNITSVIKVARGSWIKVARGSWINDGTIIVNFNMLILTFFCCCFNIYQSEWGIQWGDINKLYWHHYISCIYNLYIFISPTHPQSIWPVWKMYVDQWVIFFSVCLYELYYTLGDTIWDRTLFGSLRKSHFLLW